MLPGAEGVPEEVPLTGDDGSGAGLSPFSVGYSSPSTDHKQSVNIRLPKTFI